VSKKILIYCYILSIIAYVPSVACAWCSYPVAYFSGPRQVYCGDWATYTSSSYDPDGCDIYETWSAQGAVWPYDVGAGRSFTTKWCTTGPKSVNLRVQDDDEPCCCGYGPNCWDKVSYMGRSVTVYPVNIVSINAQEESVPLSAYTTFTVTTDPPNHYGCIVWSGGDSPPSGSGESYTPRWDTAGWKTVTATGCSNNMQKQVAVVVVDKVVKAGTTDEGPLYVCLGDTVSLEAKPFPAGVPFASGEPWWEIYYCPPGANPSLNPTSGSSTTTLSNLTVPGNYDIWATGGFYDMGDIITVTVMGVDITSSGNCILMLADGSAWTTDTALGNPPGGTYEWDAFTSGTAHVTLEDWDCPTVKIHPTAASSDPWDLTLKVTYTYCGNSCSDEKLMTIVTPESTTSTGGILNEYGSGPSRRVRRYYYHGIKDQFSVIIPITGIPCDEELSWVEGMQGWQKTGPGATANYSADGGFPGGIVVRDELECSVTCTYAKYLQLLTVGGGGTSPEYYIILDPTDYSGERLWKE
jgi:hypothetical protein